MFPIRTFVIFYDVTKPADFPRSKKPNCHLAEMYDSNSESDSEGGNDEEGGDGTEGRGGGEGRMLVVALRRIKKGEPLTLAKM